MEQELIMGFRTNNSGRSPLQPKWKPAGRKFATTTSLLANVLLIGATADAIYALQSCRKI